MFVKLAVVVLGLQVQVRMHLVQRLVQLLVLLVACRECQVAELLLDYRMLRKG